MKKIVSILLCLALLLSCAAALAETAEKAGYSASVLLDGSRISVQQQSDP